MLTHEDIDRRSFALAQAIVAEIDRDPSRAGLLRARQICARWMQNHPLAVLAEWQHILKGDWQDVRAVLLEEGETGRRLRQSNPFCGVLTPQQRWAVYRRFSRESKAA